MRKFSTEQISELRDELVRTNLNGTYFKRLQVVKWRAEGKPYAEIAEFSGFTTRWISILCAKYLESGLSGLTPNYAGSNYRKLSFKDEAEALDKLAERAEQGKYIRAADLLKQFEELTGVSYSLKSFYCLLSRHKWRKVKPRGRHPKAATAEACDASKN